MPRRRKPAAKKAPAKKASPRKPAPKGEIRSGALNMRRKNTLAEQKADLRKAMRNADVISLSEVRRNGLLSWAKKQGFGVYMEGNYDTAVIWRKDRFSLVEAESFTLNKKHGKGNLQQRSAEAVLLKDRRTGETFYQVSAHLLPRRGQTKAPMKLKNAILKEQLTTLAELMPKLSAKAPVILAGDFNHRITGDGGRRLIGGRTTEEWLADMNLAGYVDVMGSFSSGLKYNGGRVIRDKRLNTDHGMVISTFRFPKGGGKPNVAQPPKVPGPPKETPNPAPPFSNLPPVGAAPEFNAFWEGDMGGGPLQIAPGAPPKKAPPGWDAPKPVDPTRMDYVDLDWGNLDRIPKRQFIDPNTAQEMLNKVSAGYFLNNEW